MEPNNHPHKHSSKYDTMRRGVFGYTMVFQMIFTVIGLALLGDYLGEHFYPDTNLDLIFTAIGVVLGFVVSIISFVQYIKREEIYENIIVINYIAIVYTVVVGLIAYIFFKDFATWVILGAVTALFNHSLLVRFSKNKIHKDTMYLLIVFKYFIYLIMLGFMFFLLREDTYLLMYSYLAFLVGAINLKIAIFIFHLPIPAFKKMREDEMIIKKEEDDHDGISQ